MINKIKSLAKDTAIYGTFRVLGKMLSFLLTPLYAHFILGQDFAFINFIYPVIAIVGVFYSLGMEAAFFRFYNLENENDSKIAFSNAYLSIAMMSVSLTALVQIFAPDLAKIICNYLQDSESVAIPLHDMTILLRLAILIPLIDSFTWIPYDFLRMARKAKKFATIQFSLIVLNVSLTAALVIFWDMGVFGVLGSNIVASICGVFLLRKEVFRFLVFKLKPVLLKQMYRFGIPVMLANLPAMLLQIFDKLLMPGLTNSMDFNTYAVNYKLGIPMMLIVTMFEYAWKPFFLAQYKEEGSDKLFARIFTYFTLISALTFLVFALFMPFIVNLPFLGGKLIPPEYWYGMGIIPIILAGYYFNGVITNFSAGFHITKKTKYITIVMWSAAAVNVILNIILIPMVGIYGAAWATFAAYAVGAYVAYHYSRKIYPIPYEWRRLLIIVAILLACYFPVLYLTANLSYGLMFIIRFGTVIIFCVALRLFGFFTASELRQLKGLMRRK